MSIQKKIILIIFMALSVLFSGLYLGIQHIIISNHLKIEEDFTQNNVLRVKEAYQNLSTQLGIKSSDWANWDDTYKFIQDHNKTYIESNQTDTSLASLNIHFMLFVDNKNKLVASKVISEETGLGIPPSAEILKLTDPGSKFLQSPDNNFEKEGLIIIDHKPAVIVTRPILTSNKTGPSKGTLIFGFFITHETQNHIKDLVHLKTEFGFLKDDLHKTEMIEIRPETRIVSESEIEGHVTLDNIYGQPEFYIKTKQDRPIYLAGLHSVHLLAIIMSMSVLFFSGLIYQLLHQIIIKRLSLIDHDLHRISENKNHYLRVHQIGHDELGRLAKNINDTLDTLQKYQDSLTTTQQQLLQSQKLESIGKLAGGIAHDFNNILGSILGYATLLKGKLSHDENLSKKIDTIITSSQRGAELTKQLLGFARKGKYEKKEISPNQIIDECINLLHSTAKGIAIEKITDPKTSHFEGDPSQLLQVLLNLGINARDALTGQSGKIYFGSQDTELDSLALKSLQAPPHITAGVYVHLTVRDTGSGISKEIQDKIFDPFFTTKGSGKGFGMGLATVSGIVENHGGFIRLNSEPGQGTTFHLFFKAMKPSESALSQAPQQNIPVKDIDLKVIENKTILVTDDEEVLRDYIGDVLAPYHTQTLFAGDGVEGIEKAKQNKLNLAILDIIMPHKDGFQAYEAIHELYPSLPVVFVSGYSEDSKLAKLRENKNIFFVQKPYKPELLLETIALALKQGATP